MYLKIDPQIHWDIRIFFGQKRVFQQPANYPPDKQEKATQTVLQQAELLCAEWNGQSN